MPAAACLRGFLRILSDCAESHFWQQPARFTLRLRILSPPRNKREWTVGLISTVVSSIGGSAAAIQYFGVRDWVNSQVVRLMAMGGVIFACGLPGWAIVRWLFNFIDEHRDEPIDQVAKDVKDII